MNAKTKIGCVLTAAMLLSVNAADGQIGAIRVGNGLSRWDRPVHLPASPARHPINRVVPWYGPGFYQGTWPTWPSYGPGRWDDPYWDGQRRDINVNINPPPERPAPPAPRRPSQPRVIQWNAATGRAEEVNVRRWDQQGASSAQPSTGKVPITTGPNGTSGLGRWDSSRSNN